MSRTGYERRKARRFAEAERNLCGETLAAFHEREAPARTAPGYGIPRVRCDRTPSLFEGDLGNGLAPSSFTGGLFDRRT
jgi:hypothetical protein